MAICYALSRHRYRALTALELPPHKVTRVLKQFKAAKKFKKFEAKFESDMPF